jgi:signal transduction histidine kinase
LKVIRTIALSERLILNYILVSAIAIAALGGLSYYLSRKALLERTYNQLTSVRAVKKSQIENFFYDRQREVSLIASSQDVATAAVFLERKDSTKALEAFKEISGRGFLNHFLRSADYYTRFRLTNLDGRSFLISMDRRTGLPDITVIENDDPSADRLVGKAKTQKSVIQDFITDPGNNSPILWISAPVRDEQGILKGYMSCGISDKPLNDIMLENDASRGLGKTGESYLVGYDHLLRTQSRFADYYILKTKVFTEGVNSSLTEGSGVGIYKDYRGTKVIGSYDRINVPGLHWVILAELDLPEAMVPIVNLRNNLMLLSAFMAIAVFILTFLIARRITLPLVRLRNAAQEISEGKLIHVELPETHDEILELAETFNRMVTELDAKSHELKQEREDRLSAVLDGQEQERQRLSRELHDGLGQLLAATKLRLESLRPTDPDQSAKTIKAVSQGVDQTIDEIRRITNNLMPAVLKEFGLLTAIRNLCQMTTEDAGIILDFSAGTTGRDLNPKAQTYLFRIFQEALTNVVKHAQATKLSVCIFPSGDSILISIEDNGKGFHISQMGTGNGLSNIRERVNLIHGKLEFSSFPGKGSKIQIEIPINP